MAPINPTDKPAFSFKEVVYVAAIVSSFLFQQFSFRTELQDFKAEIRLAIAEQSFSKRELTQQLIAVEKRMDVQDKRINDLAVMFSPADKPKRIKMQTE